MTALNRRAVQTDELIEMNYFLQLDYVLNMNLITRYVVSCTRQSDNGQGKK